MGERQQKEIFTRNLNRFVEESGKTQLEIANAIGVSAQTFNSWCRGVAIPRMDKIQKLSDFFGVKKSDLIDEPSDADNASTLLTADERRLLNYYHMLNPIGKSEALKRIEELSQIERYIKIPGSDREAV